MLGKMSAKIRKTNNGTRQNQDLNNNLHSESETSLLNHVGKSVRYESIEILGSFFFVLWFLW